jgi:hypothetical protein
MRLIIIACSIFVLSGLAAAQVNIIGTTGAYWAPPYIYAAPFVPLITTPSASWGPTVHSTTGARNATWGNTAGARNSTMETLPVVNPYYPAGYGDLREFHEERIREVRSEDNRGSEFAEGRGEAREHHAFRPGIGEWDREGLAQMIGKNSTATKASRTYTNDDVTRMNNANGNVKYDGKTEHI